MLAIALGAARRRRTPESAVVAFQPLTFPSLTGILGRRLMVRQRDGAVLALQLFSARAGDHSKRVAAPIQQDQRLLAAFERFARLANKRAGEKLILPGLLKLPAHVDQFDF